MAILYNFVSRPKSFTVAGINTGAGAHTAGDLVFDSTQLQFSNVHPDASTSGSIAAGRQFRGTVVSLGVVDEDSVETELDVVFMSTSTSFGTVHAAPTITNANLIAGYLGTVTLSTWRAVGANSQVSDKYDIVVPFDVTGDSIYAAGITRGTPNYSNADAITLFIGLSFEE